MARILYGIMGNTPGHSMRTFSLLRRMPGHEVHLVGGGKVAAVNRGRYPLLEVPVLHTRYRNQKLDLLGTIAQIALRILQIPLVCWKIHRLVRHFQPDLLITDREFFLPIYARLTGRRCLSIDHSHILKACHIPIPPEWRRMHALNMLNDHLLFGFTKENLVVSFFHPPRKPGRREELFGPVIRPEVEALSPTTGDSLFVYLTTPGFPGLVDALKAQPRPVIFYGSGRTGTDGSITYRPYSEEGLLRDLASCAYAVVNGGHNVICEALYYGKPLLCFPISGQIEQFINVHYLRELGYGDYTYDKYPPHSLFADFEQRLDERRAAIAASFRNGTLDLVQRLEAILATIGPDSKN
jgi:uncharacterized protein (TIGR00661 family)